MDRAAAYIKTLLNYIEYPPREYESIVAVVVTGEGISRREIGRHRWAELAPMWNMAKNGFKELYNQLPGSKPAPEEAWKISGGNPSILARLYEAKWNTEEVILKLVREKRLTTLTSTLSTTERQILWEALEGPDKLLRKECITLLDKLVEANLVVDELYDRKTTLWIDEPPPEKDLELGIGKHIAWQTPLHREAVKKALEETKNTE